MKPELKTDYQKVDLANTRLRETCLNVIPFRTWESLYVPTSSDVSVQSDYNILP